jgi:hypothetical protein
MKDQLKKSNKLINHLVKELPFLNKNTKWKIEDGDDAGEYVITNSNKDVFLGITQIDNKYRTYEPSLIKGDSGIGEKDYISINVSRTSINSSLEEAISETFKSYFKYELNQSVSSTLESLEEKSITDIDRNNYIKEIANNSKFLNIEVRDNEYGITLFLDGHNDYIHIEEPRIENNLMMSFVLTNKDGSTIGDTKYYPNKEHDNKRLNSALIGAIEKGCEHLINDMISKKSLKFGKTLSDILTPFTLPIKKVMENGKVTTSSHRDSNPMGEIAKELENHGYDVPSNFSKGHVPYPDRDNIESKSHIQQNIIEFDNSNDVASITLTRMDSGKYEVVAYGSSQSPKTKNKTSRKRT